MSVQSQQEGNGLSNNQSLPVTISDVKKSYGLVQALGGVSLGIQSGEFMTMLGPSGSGKTTLLMVLAGFIRPDSGSVKFGDEEMILAPPHMRGVGMMFQNYALFPHMSVGANVAYPLKIRRESQSTIDHEVKRVLSIVQLEDYAKRGISELSGGQRQRVALARAIVFKPKILLMDEPLSALDKNLREAMQLELRAMHEELGMTTVLVTHDQREALTMSDRIAVLRDGNLAQVDNAESLYNAPNSEFVAAFMGESAFLRLDHKDGDFAFRGQKLVADSIVDGRDATPLLVLRPEKLEFISNTSDQTHYNCFNGTLENLLFQGESYLGFVRLENGEQITIRRNLRVSSKTEIPSVGDSVTVGIHHDESRIVPGGK